MHNNKEEKSTIIVSFVILGGVAIVLWLLFSWGASIMRTGQRDRAIEQFQTENQRLETENQKLLSEMLYLESAQYKDKWAKERKNKVNPGESVIILPPKEEEPIEEKLKGLSEKERRIEIMKTRPKREQWWEYFFGEPI